MFKQSSLLVLIALMMGCSSPVADLPGETASDAAPVHYDNVGECDGEPCIKSEAYHSQPFLVRAVGEERLYTVDLSYSREGKQYRGGSVEVFCSIERPTVVSETGPPYSIYGVKPDRLYPSDGETYFANVYWSVCHDVQVKDISGPEELVSRAASLGYSPDLVNTFERKETYAFFEDAPPAAATSTAPSTSPAHSPSAPDPSTNEPNGTAPNSEPAVLTEVADTSGTTTQTEVVYTRICEEGPCGEYFHTTPVLKRQFGNERLLTTETSYVVGGEERVSGPDPAQVMCSTDRPMIVKESGGEYIIFHMAPHQITSDEDMNLTSLYWSVCHNTQADSLSSEEMAQQASTLGYDLSRSFNVIYNSFFEPFEG